MIICREKIIGNDSVCYILQLFKVKEGESEKFSIKQQKAGWINERMIK